MDPLFDPAWTQSFSLLADYSGYALIAVLVGSFIWTCVALGAMSARAQQIDEAEGETKDAKKDVP